MTFTYDRPSDHPRISIKEREYIESTIGEGQDKRQRVCLAHLQPAVHNYIIISFIVCLLLLVSIRVLLSTVWCVNLTEAALGSNAGLISCFVNLCI